MNINFNFSNQFGWVGIITDENLTYDDYIKLSIKANELKDKPFRYMKAIIENNEEIVHMLLNSN